MHWSLDCAWNNFTSKFNYVSLTNLKIGKWQLPPAVRAYSNVKCSFRSMWALIQFDKSLSPLPWLSMTLETALIQNKQDHRIQSIQARQRLQIPIKFPMPGQRAPYAWVELHLTAHEAVGLPSNGGKGWAQPWLLSSSCNGASASRGVLISLIKTGISIASIHNRTD